MTVSFLQNCTFVITQTLTTTFPRRFVSKLIQSTSSHLVFYDGLMFILSSPPRPISTFKLACVVVVSPALFLEESHLDPQPYNYLY